MIAKVKASVEAREAYLRRLAIVFAYELRIKIVSELYQREMSPKEFLKEFGGGSLARVDQHFKKLAEHRWLRHVRSEGPDSRRRGGVEHFYRTRELAIIDDETWALIPYSVRIWMGWKAFKTLAERVREAQEAETLEARPESHLSCTNLDLDQLGWERATGAFAALFEAIFEEQADARLRIWHTAETPMVATVALAAFESPTGMQADVTAPQTVPELVRAPKEPPSSFSHRVSKVFADELARHILAEANMRPISVPLFHRDIGGEPIGVIRRRFKALDEAGWLLQVGEKTGGRRRAGHERFFRATGPAICDNERWAALPSSIQPGPSWEAFGRLTSQVKEAIEAGTFDARKDMHLSWSVLRLDRQGWKSVTNRIQKLLVFIQKEKGRAEHHLAKSGEQPISTTIGMGAFESPRNAIKAP